MLIATHYMSEYAFNQKEAIAFMTGFLQSEIRERGDYTIPVSEVVVLLSTLCNLENK